MKKYIPLIISGLLMIFIGFYMILRPDGFLTVVISAFGVYLIIDGVRTMLAMQRMKDILWQKAMAISMGKALLNMILGILTIIIALAAPSLIPRILVYIVATAFLITALVDLLDLLFLLKSSVHVSGLGLETILSFVFAIILYLFPNFLTGAVMTLFAAILFASGVLLIYGAISSAIFARRIRKQTDLH